VKNLLIIFMALGFYTLPAQAGIVTPPSSNRPKTGSGTLEGYQPLIRNRLQCTTKNRELIHEINLQALVSTGREDMIEHYERCLDESDVEAADLLNTCGMGSVFGQNKVIPKKKGPFVVVQDINDDTITFDFNYKAKKHGFNYMDAKGKIRTLRRVISYPSIQGNAIYKRPEDGKSARSEVEIESLQLVFVDRMMEVDPKDFDCRLWNPTAFIEWAL
jgi:hypothetical protein